LDLPEYSIQQPRLSRIKHKKKFGNLKKVYTKNKKDLQEEVSMILALLEGLFTREIDL